MRRAVLFLDWLRKLPRKRAEQAEIRAGFAEVCPELAHSAEFRGALLQILQALEQEGHVRLPTGRASWDPFGNPKLPLFVTLVRAPAPSVAPDEMAWVPELHFVTELSRADSKERWRCINEYLIQHRERTSQIVPFRERALEICGDEKAFDRHVKGGLLYGRLPLAVLGMCDPEPPLPREDFQVAGAPLLLLENHHTYWSCLQWNRTAQVYTSIAFGSGNTIQKSARALLDALGRSGASHVEYFGDLDPTGLVIPFAINEELQRLGAAPIRPALPLYRQLLAYGIRRALGPEKRSDPGSAIKWLPAELVSQVKQLFDEGQWLPQEGLGLASLTECQ